VALAEELQQYERPMPVMDTSGNGGNNLGCRQ